MTHWYFDYATFLFVHLLGNGVLYRLQKNWNCWIKCILHVIHFVKHVYLHLQKCIKIMVTLIFIHVSFLQITK